MKEKERNKRLIELITKLRMEGDDKAIELLGTMVAYNTEAMQKSYEIMTTDNFITRMLDE